MIESKLLEVRISDIVSFLYDPLQYHAVRLFGKEYEKKTERDVFEGLKFDHITNAAIKNVLLKKAIFDNKENKDEEKLKGYFEKLAENPKSANDVLKSYYGVIDEPYWTQSVRKIVRDDVETIFNSIRQNISESLDIAIDKEPENLSIPADDKNDKPVYRLKGEYSWYNENNEHNEEWKNNGLKVYSPSKIKKHLNSYVTALCLIAGDSDSDDDSDYSVSLFYGKSFEEKDGKREFNIKKKDAEQRLEKIIKAMRDGKYMKCVPYDIVLEGTEKIKSLNELYGKLHEPRGPWDYFDFKNMFATEQLGYDEDKFEEDWAAAVKEYGSFFPEGYFESKSDDKKGKGNDSLANGKEIAYDCNE